MSTDDIKPEKEGVGMHDGEIFSRLLVANRQRIYGFILSLVHDRRAAEEILQDVSMVLWRKFERFELGTDFAAWAMSVARFSIFEWRRRQQRLPLPLNDEQMERLADEAVAVAFDFDARHEALRECLKKLPNRDHELLHLRYEVSESMTRIAELTRVSRVAVYKRLNRIHVALLACVRSRLSTEDMR